MCSPTGPKVMAKSHTALGLDTDMEGDIYSFQIPSLGWFALGRSRLACSIILAHTELNSGVELYAGVSPMLGSRNQRLVAPF